MFVLLVFKQQMVNRKIARTLEFCFNDFIKYISDIGNFSNEVWTKKYFKAWSYFSKEILDLTRIWFYLFFHKRDKTMFCCNCIVINLRYVWRMILKSDKQFKLIGAEHLKCFLQRHDDYKVLKHTSFHSFYYSYFSY